MNRIPPSVERNRDPILEVLQTFLTQPGHLLEIGSGTGDHALYFAERFPEIHWVVSDVKARQKALQEKVLSAGLENLSGPQILMAGRDDFPSKKPYQYVFSANTLHIMSWKECKSLFKLLSKRLRENAVVFFYGPFNYNGEFTSESNQAFDKHLKEQNAKSGIRNFEDIVNAMEKGGFKLLKDQPMPANNRTLIFIRQAFKA